MLLFAFFAFFLVAMFYSPFPLFMDYDATIDLLQLIECIESIKSDVKKKMMLSSASDPCTKVTGRSCEEKIFRDAIATEKFSSRQNSCNGCEHILFSESLRQSGISGRRSIAASQIEFFSLSLRIYN